MSRESTTPSPGTCPARVSAMLRSADEVTVPPRITLPYAASTSTPWALKVVSKRRRRSIRLLIQRIVNAGPFCDLGSRLAAAIAASSVLAVPASNGRCFGRPTRCRVDLGYTR